MRRTILAVSLVSGLAAILVGGDTIWSSLHPKPQAVDDRTFEELTSKPETDVNKMPYYTRPQAYTDKITADLNYDGVDDTLQANLVTREVTREGHQVKETVVDLYFTDGKTGKTVLASEYPVKEGTKIKLDIMPIQYLLGLDKRWGANDPVAVTVEGTTEYTRRFSHNKETWYLDSITETYYNGKAPSEELLSKVPIFIEAPKSK